MDNIIFHPGHPHPALERAGGLKEDAAQMRVKFRKTSDFPSRRR
jgi:hypothetical protein